MTVTEEAARKWPEFLTVPETADILRVSKMTVYRLIHGGDVESIRVGRSFRIKSDSVLRIAQVGTGAAR